MRSFLLEQMARFIIPPALLFALGLLLKGHNEPGGGFVAGLTAALAGVLTIAAYGTRVFRDRMPVDPARLALVGIALALLTLVLPVLFGRPMLAHLQADLHLPGGLHWHVHTSLLFDAGVMLAVGGGGTAAAIWLWEQRSPAQKGIAGRAVPPAAAGRAGQRGARRR